MCFVQLCGNVETNHTWVQHRKGKYAHKLLEMKLEKCLEKRKTLWNCEKKE